MVDGEDWITEITDRNTERNTENTEITEGNTEIFEVLKRLRALRDRTICERDEPEI